MMKIAMPCQVKKSGCIPGGKLVIETMTEIMFKGGKSCKGLVTAYTGEIPIFGKLSVKKKFFPKCYTFFGERVGSEIINRIRPSFRFLKF